MANQLEIKRERYIQACIVKAEIEAEFQWAQAFAAAPVAMEEPDEMLTCSQAARRLKRSESWIRKQEKNMALPRVPGLGSKSVRYYASDIERLRKTLE